MFFDENYTIPKMLKDSAEKWPEIYAQYRRLKNGEFEPITYRDMYQTGLDFGAGLMSIGVKREDPVGLISDNRPEWFQADLGVMAIGAVDVPRGCDATLVDLEKILSLTESKVVIAENNSQVNKILSIHDKIPAVSVIIVLADDVKDDVRALCDKEKITLHTFAGLVSDGQKYRIENKDCVENEMEKGKADDLATIIFTSGTTGTPKGVMLTYRNFLTQLDELQERIYLNPGEKALSVLPVWHVFEREVEYVITIQGCGIVYSKPVGSILLADFKTMNPHILPAVPRVFEAVYDGIIKKMRKTGGIVYKMFTFFVAVAKIHSRMHRCMFRKNACYTSYKTVMWWFLFIIPWALLFPLKWLGNLLVFRKIKAMLGNNFRGGVAGGGSFPKVIDEFFWAIGVKVVEGYGMTETAPVVAVRPMAAPIFRTIGSPIRGVKARIVDADGYVLGRCKEGILQIKGDTVMKGYYKRPDLTEKAMSVDGWLNTGDLAILTIHDELSIRGRVKDTIVLRGGENVEPVPLEQKLTESRYIKTAVVVGQDMKYLGALILVDGDEVRNFAAENGIQYDTYESLLESQDILKLYESEIGNLISSKNGFKMYERINRFALITKDFEVGVELSAKQEVSRFRINDIYKDKIEGLFKE